VRLVGVVIVAGLAVGAPAAHAESWLVGDPLRATTSASSADVARLPFDEEGPGNGFVVGGALGLDDIELGAQFAQREHRVGTSASVRATLSTGSVTTSLSYTDDAPTPTGNRFALGAAVEAAPGLNVGAGLALDDLEGAGHDGDTTGMVRFQLQF
jgi:hypothetical protein